MQIILKENIPVYFPEFLRLYIMYVVYWYILVGKWLGGAASHATCRQLYKHKATQNSFFHTCKSEAAKNIIFQRPCH